MYLAFNFCRLKLINWKNQPQYDGTKYNRIVIYKNTIVFDLAYVYNRIEYCL